LQDDEGEISPENTKRTVIWAIFGVACLLAIIVPAGIVIYRAQHAATAQSGNVTVIPAPGAKTSVETTSTESTKTVSSVQDETDASASSDDALGQSLENWDYYRSGRNIMEPVKGSRVVDSSTAINPKYIATVYDALDISEHAANGVSVIIPKTASFSGSDSTSGGSDSASSPTQLTLEGIGSSNGKKVAAFVVGGKTYEAKVGETIGATDWSVKSIGTASVIVTDGSSTYTLKIADGSK
jgi:hypothetical protein